MYRAALLGTGLALLGGCGRVGFAPADERDGGPGDRADGAAGDGDGGAPPGRVIHVGGAATQEINDVAFGPDGALALVGSFGGTLQLGMETATTSAGGGDLFAAVLEVDGRARWLTALGASSIGSGQNVAWEDGIVHVGGFFGGTATLGGITSGSGQDVVHLQLAPATGGLSMVGHYGGSSNVQLRAMAAQGPTVALGGVYGGAVAFGATALPLASADNGFVAVAPGAGVAQRAFTGSSDVYVNDLAFGAGGALCVTGRYNTTTDFGAGPVGPVGGSSGFVIRFDPGLVHRWSRVWGGGINGTAVAATDDGGCAAGGAFTGTIDVDGFSATSAGDDDLYVLRFDGAGAARWLRTASSPGGDIALALAPLARDRLAVAGRLGGAGTLLGAPATVAGASDAFVAVLDAAGAVEQVTVIGGAGEVTSANSGLAVDAAGAQVALGLRFTGELALPTGAAAVAPDTDAAIVVLPVAP